jgi:hypothetical protein
MSPVTVAVEAHDNDPTDRDDAPLWRIREALALPNEQP